MSDSAARVEGLRVSLVRDGVRSDVLRGIDLTVGRGEILGMVGESGSGKSVLALAMMGLLPVAADPQVDGTIRVGDVDMVHGSPEQLRAVRRNELGVIFQDPMTSLNPTMRVGAQITEATHDSAESIRLMSAVGIADAPLRFTVYPHELSGGLRQRIMAAIAVAGRPSLIIADEPTTALDVTVQAQVLDLLRELRDEFGCSVMLITHDLAVAAQIADRVAVMYAGRIAEIGATEEIIHRPTHPYTVGLLRSRLSLDTPRDRRLLTLRPETASAAERMKGCAYHSRCPLAVERCATEQPPLAPASQGDTAGTADTATEHLRACWRTVADVQGYTHETSDATPIASLARPGASADTTATPAAPAVRITDLTTVFALKGGGRRKRQVHALRGVDLTVAAGEAVSIVGESGSGKSTLLRVIAGLAPATTGRVELAGRGAQMVFQDAGSSLTPWLTVGDILRERLRPAKLDRAAASRRIGDALEAIGLPETVAALRPAQLSGGQRQRVALARATIIPPSVLLCDEPTSALDASLAASVLNLIRELRRSLDMTVLFVTHDLAVARLMGDRVVVMTEGTIVESGDADDVIHHPEHPYTRSLLASVPDIGVLS
ncbi:ABC transporter ATP-binding protein [Agreia sp. Leaf283]|uniref:oligopeptide/dipeptide ABC transporter ATP-binding protein n=1 Tax=Agreia sp. Leaf283 TaxID=1736321 RepID=UPI0006FD1EBF|nr:ABC transporter ATP-binding protein [Agreia sp. Leaf283]KQP57210.1 peptide ABC transporter ATP-binding protein [Agreia sp. Leaf283]